MISKKALNKTQKNLLDNWSKEYNKKVKVFFAEVDPASLFHEIISLSEDLFIAIKITQGFCTIQIVTKTEDQANAFKKVIEERDLRTSNFFQMQKLRNVNKEEALEIKDLCYKSVASYRAFVINSYDNWN